MTTTKLYDALIIGGGPGGLTVALGLARQSRSCLVISHKRFRNDGIEASHAVLGHDHVHPQAILAKAREQIERYGNTSYAEAEIVAAQRRNIAQWHGREGFQVKSKDGRSWTGRTLVLATGVRDVMPDLEGYQENWPRNIYQCLFCDGWERRRSEKAILGFPSFNLQDSKMASMALGQYTDRGDDGFARVTMLTNGPFESDKVDSVIEKQVKAVMARGVKLDERKVIQLENAEPDREGVYVHLKGEGGQVERVFFGFLVHKPDTKLNAESLIGQLGLEVVPGMFGNVVKTGPMIPTTNVPGVYVAGDSGNLMTHISTAMSSGMGAAGGIVHYLNEKDDEDALSSVGQQDTVIDGRGVDGTGCSIDA